MHWSKGLVSIALAALILAGGALAEKQIVLTFVGDCTVGGEDRLITKDTSFNAYVEKEGYGYFSEKVKDFFSEDDLTVANFEGVLKETDSGAVDKTYCFRGQPEFAQILPLGGIEAVNLANNHAGDYGAAGRVSTLEALAAAGVQTFNETDTYVYEKDGVKIAFCGFWGVGFNKRADMAERVRKLKEDGANAVVCVMHYGEEYATYHNKAQIQVSRLVIDAGADLVVGSHPHVVQGTETYQNRMVFYSLGNFLFGGNATVRANECLVPRVTLTFSDDGEYLGQQTTLYAANTSGDSVNNDYQPRLVQGDAAQAVFERIDVDNAGDQQDVQKLRSDLGYDGVTETAYRQADGSRVFDYLPAQTDEAETEAEDEP